MAFEWTNESEMVFQQLKEYMGSPPLLIVPDTGEELILYLSVSPTAVSAVLIKEECKVQMPIYYVSKVLLEAETKYLKIEKLTSLFWCNTSTQTTSYHRTCFESDRAIRIHKIAIR